MSDNNWSFSQSFSAEFQASRSDLEARVNAARQSTTVSQQDIQALSLDLAKLTKSFADATGSLPTYDQKQYELQLKTVEKSLETLRASSTPKSKFAFKRKPPAPASSTPVPVISLEDNTPSELRASTTESLEPTNDLDISGFSYQYITADSLQTSAMQSSLSISNLDHCIVNLLPSSAVSSHSQTSSTFPSISAVHVRNLSNTLLMLPNINGSILLHDLSFCTIVVGCHQFRMHSSQSVDVYLSIPSNPIIEHCDKIRFAYFPDRLALILDQKDRGDFAVQDFSHIRSTQSPHWSTIEADDQVEEWPISTLPTKTDLEHALNIVLPK